jgi:hypothetical protein
MKKQNIIIGVIVVIVIIIIAVIIGKHGSSTPATGSSTGGYIAPPTGPNANATTTTPIPDTVVASSSNGVSLYTNNELGFSIDYPTTWKLESDPSGPSFTIPVTITGTSASTQNTIATLAASIYTTGGACTFPSLGASATVKESTTTVGTNSFATLSVQNSTSNLNYTDAMYTLQQGSGKDQYCYVFAFGAVATKTSAAVDSDNNTAIITQASQDFTTLVKSFQFVTGPAGQSETAHPTGN